MSGRRAMKCGVTGGTVRVTGVAAVLVLSLLAIGVSAERRYRVGAFYYGPWHIDPTNEGLHGKNWTEWNLVKTAQPRFPNHVQPNVPQWGYEMDNDPTVMAKKIDAAADNGVDHFLFDWYWYNETSTNGVKGLFQDSALEQGFLAAPNRKRVDFALMWASQEWMDVHPAVGPNIAYGDRTPTFKGAIDRGSFEAMTDHIVSRYFSQPNYLRVQTKAGGPECAFFSIYELPTFVAGQGGVTQARAALDAFRAKAVAAGEKCMHISTQSGSADPAQAKALGLDSTANYCWYHTTGSVLNAPSNFPVAPHAAMLKGSVQAWHDMTAKWAAAGLPYIPNLSVQWDSSPRTALSDVFQLGVYPFTGTFRSTPAEWLATLQAGKEFLDATCAPDSTWCPITINAWNEWSEGAYLEPDVQYGMAKLQAIKAVFGANATRSKPVPKPAAVARTPVVGAIRWDAYFSQPGEAAYEDPNFGIVTRTTTIDMSPKKWHYRVPFFGEEVNDTAIIANGNSPAIMGAELNYAAQHGIQFWSFCSYPIGCTDMHPPASDCKNIQCCADNVGLSYAWNLYLNHPENHKVNFTVLLQPGYWFPTSLKGGNETLEQEVDRYISYFKMSNYQKVLGGRPLVFLFGGQVQQSDLSMLRERTHAALGVYPYVASMNGQAIPGMIDAISAYGTGGGTPQGGPYVDYIAKPEAARWASWAAAGKKVIPTVSAGWDNRPRIDDCPWGNGSEVHVIDPTMEELQNHTAAGLQWVAANPNAAETGLMLLSAWNEHDEGHWIEPALPQYGGTEKLEAIKRAIEGAK